MTCDEFGRMLDNYANLTDEEKLSLNEHALICGKCRAELDFMLEMIAQLNVLPEIKAPEDFGAKLNERLGTEERVGMLRPLRRYVRQYSTVAACLILAVIVGVGGKNLIGGLSSEKPGGNGGADTPSSVSDTAGDGEYKHDKPIITAVRTEDSAEAPQAQPQSGEQAESVRESSDKTASAPKASVQTASAGYSRTAPEPVRQSAASQTSSEASVPEIERSGAVEEIPADEDKSSDASYTVAKAAYTLPEESSQTVPETENTEALGQDIKITRDDKTTIARGRYYLPADDGYIVVDRNNKLGVEVHDKSRAAEIIHQYADIEDSSYYVISSENLPRMLEHMDGEGINYQNNVENTEYEQITFKLVTE